jgi:hypothetical protein
MQREKSIVARHAGWSAMMSFKLRFPSNRTHGEAAN